MKIDVLGTLAEALDQNFTNKTVVVIDTLRATSTITTALANGASEVIALETVEEAQQLAQNDDVLGGERLCQKIEGFHLGNSPLEYTPSFMGNRRLLLTTTNGTKALACARAATHVLAGAMLNARACAKAIFHFNKDTVLLCSGTRGDFALEDGLSAGFILSECMALAKQTLCHINDFGLAMHAAYLQNQNHIDLTFMQSASGQRLCKLGFSEDIDYCSKKNRLDIVPVVQISGTLKAMAF